jgi:hypothetical protein
MPKTMLGMGRTGVLVNAPRSRGVAVAKRPRAFNMNAGGWQEVARPARRTNNMFVFARDQIGAFFRTGAAPTSHSCTGKLPLRRSAMRSVTLAGRATCAP